MRLTNLQKCTLLFLKLKDYRKSSDENQQNRSGPNGGRGVARLTASWRTSGNDRLEQMYTHFGRSQFVHRLAHIIAVLPLLNRYHTNRGIGKLVGGGEMRNLVVLIVGQRNVVLGPDDRRQWIRLDVTL